MYYVCFSLIASVHAAHNSLVYCECVFGCRSAVQSVSECVCLSVCRSVYICFYFCPLLSGCAYSFMDTYQCKGGGGEGMNSFPGVSHRACRLVMSHKSTAIFLRSALSEGEPLQGMPFRAFHRLSGCWKQSNSHTLY